MKNVKRRNKKKKQKIKQIETKRKEQAPVLKVKKKKTQQQVNLVAAQKVMVLKRMVVVTNLVKEHPIQVDKLPEEYNGNIQATTTKND